MRIRESHPFSVESGRVVVCDPGFVFPASGNPPYFEAPPNVPYIGGFGGDGIFDVYRSGDLVVIDTAPRLFRASTREGFTRICGQVGVDSGMICFIDGGSGSLGQIECSDEFLAEIEIENGNYHVWLEEHDTSMGHRRAIVAMASAPKLLLSGDDADRVQEIEADVARYFRAKGNEKVSLGKYIENRILDLHWAKSKDKRLRLLAESMGINLPARRGARPHNS